MWDKFRSSSEDKENVISQPKLIETTYDENRLSALPTVVEARKASFGQDRPSLEQSATNGTSFGLSPFSFEKKSLEGRKSSDVSSPPRTVVHSSPEVQYSFNASNPVLPLFAGKPMPQRLSQTFTTLAANAQDSSLGVPTADRPISDYDSAPEINTAVRASRVPLGEMSTQIIGPKPALPLLREPWRGASGSSDQLTPIFDSSTPGASSKAGSGYFSNSRLNDSLATSLPDSTERTIETAEVAIKVVPESTGASDSLVVPVMRTWRSASTGNTPVIRIDTPPVIVRKEVHHSPKSVTRYNWGAKAVERPPGTPDSSVSSGTWNTSRISESVSNPTLRETALLQSTVARSAAKATTLAPIPQSPILNRKRPVPRPRDHIVEKSAAEVYAEAASSEATPEASIAGDMSAQDDCELTPKLQSSRELHDVDRTPSPPTLSIHKTRARSPPRDRTEVLQTELDNLTSRRRTLERLVRNITEFAPPNPMVRDLATRREEAERIQAVERELAETRRREHEVGLKLVKAWQKRQYENGAQFWVRRVTK